MHLVHDKGHQHIWLVARPSGSICDSLCVPHRPLGAVNLLLLVLKIKTFHMALVLLVILSQELLACPAKEFSTRAFHKLASFGPLNVLTALALEQLPLFDQFLHVLLAFSELVTKLVVEA